MDLRHVRSVVAVTEDGGLRSAAGRIHLSPAAVHKHVRLLEEELGVRLYERRGRGLKPTQAMEMLIPHLKELLAEHDSTIQAVEEWKGRKRGFVRVGSGPAAATYLLPPLLDRFHRRYPGVDLHVETGSPEPLVDRLSTGALDAVMLLGPFPERARMEQVIVWQTEIVMVTALKDAPRRCALLELATLPFVLFNRGSTMDNLIGAYFAAAGFRPRVVMRCESSETVKAMVRRGFGVAMLPLWSVDEDLRHKSLRLLHQREATLYSNITLLVRKASYTPQAVEALLDIARGFPWKTPRLRT